MIVKILGIVRYEESGYLKAYLTEFSDELYLDVRERKGSRISRKYCCDCYRRAFQSSLAILAVIAYQYSDMFSARLSSCYDTCKYEGWATQFYYFNFYSPHVDEFPASYLSVADIIRKNRRN